MSQEKNILVVDDERELVESIKLELEENQFDVLTAFDAPALLAKIQELIEK